MTPYDQQMFGAGVAGDCLVTCVESLLELPQGTLPKPALAHFRSADHFAGYVDDVRAALEPLNLDLLFLTAEAGCFPDGFAICAQELRPGATAGHCRVLHAGQLAHDPCPELRGQPLGAVVEWVLLVPLDPSRPCGRFALETQP